MMKKNIRQKGFTLIEVIISIAIFSLLMLAINALFLSLYKQQGSTIAMTERTQNMNRLIGTMERELREGNRAENGNFFIASAQENAITFYSDINSDGLTEKIAYALDGTDLKKTVTAPGADSLYSGAGTTSVVCAEIQNGTSPIFTYYDENYIGTGAALSSPIPVLSIRLIGISFKVNTLVQNRSYPLFVETKVRLRNIN